MICSYAGDGYVDPNELGEFSENGRGYPFYPSICALTQLLGSARPPVALDTSYLPRDGPRYFCAQQGGKPSRQWEKHQGHFLQVRVLLRHSFD